MLTLTSPLETRLHRLPAGAKLGALALFGAGLFLIRSPTAGGVTLACVAVLYLVAGGWPLLVHGLRLLRPLWPFVAVVLVWHLWTDELRAGAIILLRMLAAVAAANLVTMTTRLSDMLVVFETLCRPFAALIPPRRLALAFAMVIRFVPRMAESMAMIRMGWSARSARRPGPQILVPVVLAALDDADRAAEALRARGGVD